MRTHKLLTTAIIVTMTACGGSGGGNGNGSSASSGASNGSEVTLVDPYIEGGTLFWDKNENGQFDNDEPVSAASNNKGVAKFSVKLDEGAKLIQLGKGVSGGKKFKGKLKTSFSSSNSIATPITTLRENGYSDQDILTIVNEATANFAGGSQVTYTNINDLIVNPMTAVDDSTGDESALNPLRASMAVTAVLNANPKGFDSTPTDITVNSFKTDFKKKADVLEKIVNTTKISSPEKMIKTATAIQDYMTEKGLEELENAGNLDTTKISAAISAVETAFDGAGSNNVDISLKHDGTSFSGDAQKLATIPDGTYDYIGFHISTYSRDSTDAAKFWGPNVSTSIDFGEETFQSGSIADDDEFSFDSNTGIMSLKYDESYSNGEIVDYAGISYNSQNLGFAVNTSKGTGAFQFYNPEADVYRAKGSVDIELDWIGARPNGNGTYTVDTSVNNYCVEFGSDTTNYSDYSIVKCSDHTEHAGAKNPANGYFTFKDEQLKVESAYLMIDPANTDALGNSYNFKFALNGDDNSKVYEVTLGTSIVSASLETGTQGGYSVVQETGASLPINMSFAFSHRSDYDNFPTTYPIEKFSGITINDGTSNIVTTLSSTKLSFHKHGVLLLHLGATFDVTNSTVAYPVEWLLLDLKTKKGFAISNSASYNKIFELDVF